MHFTVFFVLSLQLFEFIVHSSVEYLFVGMLHHSASSDLSGVDWLLVVPGDDVIHHITCLAIGMVLNVTLIDGSI